MGRNCRLTHRRAPPPPSAAALQAARRQRITANSVAAVKASQVQHSGSGEEKEGQGQVTLQAVKGQSCTLKAEAARHVPLPENFLGLPGAQAPGGTMGLTVSLLFTLRSPPPQGQTHLVLLGGRSTDERGVATPRRLPHVSLSPAGPQGADAAGVTVLVAVSAVNNNNVAVQCTALPLNTGVKSVLTVVVSPDDFRVYINDNEPVVVDLAQHGGADWSCLEDHFVIGADDLLHSADMAVHRADFIPRAQGVAAVAELHRLAMMSDAERSLIEHQRTLERDLYNNHVQLVGADREDVARRNAGVLIGLLSNSGTSEEVDGPMRQVYLELCAMDMVQSISKGAQSIDDNDRLVAAQEMCATYKTLIYPKQSYDELMRRSDLLNPPTSDEMSQLMAYLQRSDVSRRLDTLIDILPGTSPELNSDMMHFALSYIPSKLVQHPVAKFVLTAGPIIFNAARNLHRRPTSYTDVVVRAIARVGITLGGMVMDFANTSRPYVMGVVNGTGRFGAQTISLGQRFARCIGTAQAYQTMRELNPDMSDGEVRALVESFAAKQVKVLDPDSLKSLTERIGDASVAAAAWLESELEALAAKSPLLAAIMKDLKDLQKVGDFDRYRQGVNNFASSLVVGTVLLKHLPFDGAERLAAEISFYGGAAADVMHTIIDICENKVSGFLCAAQFATTMDKVIQRLAGVPSEHEVVIAWFKHLDKSISELKDMVGSLTAMAADGFEQVFKILADVMSALSDAKTERAALHRLSTATHDLLQNSLVAAERAKLSKISTTVSLIHSQVNLDTVCLRSQLIQCAIDLFEHANCASTLPCFVGPSAFHLNTQVVLEALSGATEAESLMVLLPYLVGQTNMKIDMSGTVRNPLEWARGAMLFVGFLSHNEGVLDIVQQRTLLSRLWHQGLTLATQLSTVSCSSSRRAFALHVLKMVEQFADSFSTILSQNPNLRRILASSGAAAGAQAPLPCTVVAIASLGNRIVSKATSLPGRRDRDIVLVGNNAELDLHGRMTALFSASDRVLEMKPPLHALPDDPSGRTWRVGTDTFPHSTCEPQGTYHQTCHSLNLSIAVRSGPLRGLVLSGQVHVASICAWHHSSCTCYMRVRVFDLTSVDVARQIEELYCANQVTIHAVHLLNSSGVVSVLEYAVQEARAASSTTRIGELSKLLGDCAALDQNLDKVATASAAFRLSVGLSAWKVACFPSLGDPLLFGGTPIGIVADILSTPDQVVKALRPLILRPEAMQPDKFAEAATVLLKATVEWNLKRRLEQFGMDSSFLGSGASSVSSLNGKGPSEAAMDVVAEARQEFEGAELPLDEVHPAVLLSMTAISMYATRASLAVVGDRDIGGRLSDLTFTDIGRWRRLLNAIRDPGSPR